MPKSAGASPPHANSALTTHSLPLNIPTFLSPPSPSTIPSTTIWRARSTSTSTTPKPFSFQLYLTTSRAPSSFAVDLLATLTAQIAPTYEQWRLDIHDVSALEWGAKECVEHYRALEEERRGEGVHTVKSYFADGLRFRGILFMFDDESGGQDGGVEEKEVVVVQFDKGRDGEERMEDGCGEEEKWGTVIRESRRQVKEQEGRGTLGGLLESIWNGMEAKAEYEAQMG